MKRVSRFLLCAAAAALFQTSTAPNASADSLGPTLSTFAVLGATEVTNASGGGSAATIITGNLGVCCIGTSITGFPPGIVTGDIQGGTEAAAAAELVTAYNNLGGLANTGGTITAGGLSGATLAPGVYDVNFAAFDLAANSILTLDPFGDTVGSWVFRMQSSLIAGPGTKVDVSQLGAGNSVYWVVRSSATLGANTDFAGNILALTSITFDPGATVLCGRALAQNGLVSFAGVGTTPRNEVFEPNQVGGGCLDSGDLNGGPGEGQPIPEPGTLALLGSGIAGLVARRRRAARARLQDLAPKA